MKNIHIEFMVAKKEGCGEDSEPLSFNGADICAVGVFDGMGGSGAAPGIIKNEDGNTIHTQAYYASRLVKSAVEKALQENESQTTIEILKTYIKKIYEENVVKSETGLITRMLRPYPTTMAIVTVSRNKDKYDIMSFWAGDSRNYLWSLDGFYQISNDDLKGGEDPFENLRNDGVLSNCISSDSRFDINVLKIAIDTPFIVLSATDGCFGYFQAPMYFEHILRQTLQESANEHEWQEKIKEEILKVTGDDISMSLTVVGICDFDVLKNQFGKYNGRIVEGIEVALRKLEKDMHEARQEYERQLDNLWGKYKYDYMHYFPEIIDKSPMDSCLPMSCSDENHEIEKESKVKQSGRKNPHKYFKLLLKKNNKNKKNNKKNVSRCKREKK